MLCAGLKTELLHKHCQVVSVLRIPTQKTLTWPWRSRDKCYRTYGDAVLKFLPFDAWRFFKTDSRMSL